MASFSYRHWVPAKVKLQDFPFMYDIEQVKDFEGEPHNEFDYIDGEDLKEAIKNCLINTFDFNRYLGVFSDDFLHTYPEKTPTYILKINRYTIKKTEVISKSTNKKSIKKEKQFVENLFISVTNFKSEYSFTLIRSIDQLKYVFDNFNFNNVIGYDAETTGLNPDDDYITGMTFALNPKQGFYVAIEHDDQFAEYNLGEEAVKLIYEFMAQAKVVYLFNSRFDIRFLEKRNPKYSFANIKFIDTQISMYFSDPDWKEMSLKWAEKHFLGYYRPNLSDTMKANSLDTFNTALINPEKMTFYGAQDGISTLELGYETNQYIQEFGLSGELDQAIIYPLMEMEDRPMLVNVELLEENLNSITQKKDEIDSKLKTLIGDINLNSPKQKIQLFESFGLDTGVRTESGAMSTGTEAVEKMIERMEENGEDFPEWLRVLGERAKLEKLQTSFFGALYEYVKLVGNRIRLHYRHGSTATGRFSSGKEENA